MVAMAVMGAGSWGTAMAKVCADAGNAVTIWARRKDVTDAINRDHCNADYFPDVTLPDSVVGTNDAAAALADADIVILAVPSQTLRSNLENWKDQLSSSAIIVSLAKGLEHDTDLRMSELIKEVTGVEPDRIAVLSGPNLAGEVMDQQPTATVIACANENNAKLVQSAVATQYFRPYTNTDIVGCEIGGVCKNVIALACGMASGRGFGDNTLATIITRGLAETTRLGIALGAEPRTFSGLAGLGDLVATCHSPLSRNRTFGARLGEGRTLDEAREASRGQVAEGVISCLSVQALAQREGIDVPIADAVVDVCHRDANVNETIAQLMSRSRKAE